MVHRKLTSRKRNKNYSKKINRRKLTNKKNRKQHGGGTSKKLSGIIKGMFQGADDIKYLPSTFVFLGKTENRYVNMVDLDGLRNIIDSDKYLKSSNIITNIYKNKGFADLKVIKQNVFQFLL